MSETIGLGPTIQLLSPFVNAVVGIVVPAGVAWAVYELRRLTGLKISDQQTAAFQSTAATEAGALLAASETNLAGQSFTPSSPAVVRIAAGLTTALPEVVKALDLQPQDVAKVVAGEIGKLQASGPTAIVTRIVNVTTETK